MIRYELSKGAKILFIGINPHPGSFKRGVPFSNNKTFWYLLNSAGLIEEDASILKDDRILKKVYSSKFAKKYGFNLLNIINRPSINVSYLRKDEENKGRKLIFSSIKKYRPNIVCFIGKITFQKFAGVKQVRFGWQKSIYESKVFVMHFPIRGKAEIRIKELKKMAKIARF